MTRMEEWKNECTKMKTVTSQRNKKQASKQGGEEGRRRRNQFQHNGRFPFLLK